MAKYTVKDVMVPNIVIIGPESSLREATQEMEEIDCGLMPVGTQEKLIGIITDRDIAIRAVAKERQGARLVGIDVEKIFAISYGIGIGCLGAAACLLMPTFYVTPQSGYAFVLVAFTIVVLGGMGSFLGAAVGGFLIGVTESLGGLFLGEQLGQIGISLIFILILLFKPTGLFGAKN